jgi:hypothetical protein|tara:strand:- start:1227 stop:1445 length:219 start_codon:yes stop_codon:yes gene_type:complete
MVRLDVSVIQTQKGVQVATDDIKEWILTIIILPIFILGFVVLYIIMVASILVAMLIDWWIAIPYQRRNGEKK